MAEIGPKPQTPPDTRRSTTGAGAVSTDDELRRALHDAQEQIADLRAREERLIEAQRLSGVGSYDFEIASNTNRWSDQLYRVYGREPQSFEATYEVFLSLLHPDDREHVMATHQRSLATLEPFRMEERVVWPDGTVRTLESWGEVVTDDAGNPTRMRGICWDVTERYELQQQIVQGRLVDALTGMPNRLSFEEHLALALQTLSPGATSTAVLLVGVDRLKVINDSLGHAVGDQVLLEVASRLRSAVRSGDVVARFSGDAFVVLCEGLHGANEALRVAEHLQAGSRKPFRTADNDLSPSVSIGIAVAVGGESQPGDLLRDADAALSHAKRTGRGRCALFADQMREQVLVRLETEAQLRRALHEDELRVHYQPVVDLVTGQVGGLEALVRWQHPVRGLVTPSDFIPVAEETGLIVPLGSWVLERACEQLVEWDALRPGLTLSVNVSGSELAEPDVVTRVAEVLDRTGVEPGRVALEITETELMRDPDEVLVVLTALKALGLQLHVDDFGTGYSSLSRLKRFPVDTLKVDRSFVSGLPDDGEDAAIVQAVVALAGALGLSTVAEGVETHEQLATLKALGCGSAQGYLLGRPADPAAITPMLAPGIPQIPQAAPAGDDLIPRVVRRI
jgi:diguanylate cyclase (GGDEF)-like protein/PAS domain S-box-containing protein